MGVCNCSMFCCTLLYVHSSVAIILMGKRELIALLNLSSWCLVMAERLFLAVPRGCLQFVIVVFTDHSHLLFIPDVIKLLEEYHMLHIVHIFVDTSRFPIKNAWNRLLKGRLHQNAICSWNSRTLTQEFYRFRIVHPQIQPHWTWHFSISQQKVMYHRVRLLYKRLLV